MFRLKHTWWDDERLHFFEEIQIFEEVKLKKKYWFVQLVQILKKTNKVWIILNNCIRIMDVFTLKYKKRLQTQIILTVK